MMFPMTAVDVFLLLLLGAVLALDQEAGLGLQLSQPLVAAGLAGWILGRFEAGVAVGAGLQLLWMTVQPVGGARLPDLALASLAAVLALPASWRTLPLLEQDQLAAPLVLGILAGWGGGWVIRVQRRLHAVLARRHAPALDSGDARAIAAVQREAIALHGVRGILGVLCMVLVAPSLAAWLEQSGLRLPVMRFAAAIAVVALLRVAGGRWRKVAFIGFVVGFLPGVF